MKLSWQNFFGGGMGRNSVRYYKTEINGKRCEMRENYAGKKFSIGNFDEAKKKYNSEEELIKAANETKKKVPGKK